MARPRLTSGSAIFQFVIRFIGAAISLTVLISSIVLIVKWQRSLPASIVAAAIVLVVDLFDMIGLADKSRKVPRFSSGALFIIDILCLLPPTISALHAIVNLMDWGYSDKPKDADKTDKLLGSTSWKPATFSHDHIGQYVPITQAEINSHWLVLFVFILSCVMLLWRLIQMAVVGGCWVRQERGSGMSLEKGKGTSMNEKATVQQPVLLNRYG